MNTQDNIVWHSHKIKKKDREKLKDHSGMCIWLTGLSGSGKSSIANELEYMLNRKGLHTYLLDGDNIRHGLNKDLGFSPEDRTENIRRIGEVAKLFVDAGIIVITAFISPFRKDREEIRSKFDHGEFLEVYIECDISICEQRDPKNLYKKARESKVADFTGISSPYEPPENPDLVVNTSNGTTVKENALYIYNYLLNGGYIK